MIFIISMEFLQSSHRRHWAGKSVFSYLVVLVWTMALLAVKTLNMGRICFDPWLLTKITDRKGIILNKNQLQYLNEFIKPNLWNYQLFAWNTWETTWAYMPQENKNWNTGCRLWEKSPYIPCKIANFNTIIVFNLRKFAICIDF